MAEKKDSDGNVLLVIIEIHGLLPAQWKTKSDEHSDPQTKAHSYKNLYEAYKRIFRVPLWVIGKKNYISAQISGLN